VASRLDRFADKWSRTIDDYETQDQFLLDVADLKKRVLARAGTPRHQLVEDYRAMLTAQMGKELDPHMREWYTQQIDPLNSKNEKFVESQIQTYLRYDTIEDLKGLAKKYGISDRVIRNYGLHTSGRPHDWQSMEAGLPQ